MTRLIPTVLVPAECLPLAELCAARLDGEVVALDECFMVVDTPENDFARADALLALVGERAVAARESALWIYGLVPAVPRIHTVCIDRDNRSAAPHSLRVVVRESRFLPGDLLQFGAMAVTSPVRTVYDLARAVRLTPPERDGIHALTRRFDLDVETCRARLEAIRNLPGRRRALRRLLGA